MHVIRWIGLAFLLSGGPISVPVPAESKTEAVSPLELSATEFRQHPRSEEPLQIEKLDRDWLAAAIFHETNLRRAAHELPPLESHPDAREAAAIQARIMAEAGEVRHHNPGMEEKETLTDRLALVELRPAFAAENVASAFLLQYESGRPVFVRKENVETVFSYEPEGEPLLPHTYRSFAEALLDQWMKSPGHRQNILEERPRYLGTEAVPALGGKMPLFYCVQVFFTPL